MPSNIKRVFYPNRLAHQSFADVLAGRSDVRLDRIANDTPEAEAGPIIRDAHVYQIGSARDELAPALHAHAGLLARAPNLLLVSTHGAGYDTVDLAACTAAGVLVVNQAGGNREAVAEHALAMMLTLSKRIGEADRALRRGGVEVREALMGNDVFGKTIGIIGLGHVGRRLAELCRMLFSMRVLAYDPYLSATEIQERGAEKVELAALLRASDYVSINCPLTAETRGMIGAREIAQMQPYAYLVTTARGNIHDEAALLEALREKRIAGAGLDVWEKEPPPADHPLLACDNVIASPHTAGVTHEARANVGKIAAEQVLHALAGGRPERILNPAAWDAYAVRFERVFGLRPR